MAKGKFPCDNCGGEHYYTDFLHPCDEAKIKNDKEECAAHKGGSGRNGVCGGRRQGDLKKWIKYKKDVDRNDYGNGVQKRGNDWMCYFRCKECGWNENHTSVFHAAWKRDTGTFALLADHDYWKLSGNTVGVATGTGETEGSGLGTQAQHRSDIYEVISCHQGEATYATFY